MKLALLSALAAAAVTLLVPATSSASPFIRFGAPGRRLPVRRPGAAEPRLADARPARARRLVRFTWSTGGRSRRASRGEPVEPERPGLRLVERSTPCSKRPARAQDRRARDALRDAGLGQRRPAARTGCRRASTRSRPSRSPWRRATPGSGCGRSGTSRTCSRFLSPNSPALYVQRLLNPTYAVLTRLRPTNRVAGGATSPRLDADRPLAGRVHARNARRPRPARRLLAPSVPGHARRAALGLRAQRLQATARAC